MATIPFKPQPLGSVTGIAAATAAPTLVTEGFPTNDSRFINLWVKITGFGSISVATWVYHTITGWVQDLPPTIIPGANLGQFMEFELRGPQRIYLQVTLVVGAGTVDVVAEGITYP